MAEYISNAPQTVAAGTPVLFANTNNIGCPCGIPHRSGSGLFTLRGGHKYRVRFGANVSAAEATTASTLAIAVNGETIPGTQMVTTSVAAGDLGNVSSEVIICVPKCCCYQLSIQNAGAQAATVQNSNLIIDKEA